MSDAPLIIGGGPAGSAVAIHLARAGARPLLIERQVETGDALCGGFLSWRTLARLDDLSIDINGLGAQPIHRVRLFARDRITEAKLPAQGAGLSRKTLDSALLEAAGRAGAQVLRGISAIEAAPGRVRLSDGTMREPASLFLATGKRDLRGLPRPASRDADPELGLRWRLSVDGNRAALVGDAIELFLFEGGYVGLLMQEDGRINACAAVRKSRLAEADGRPETLLARWADASPALAARIGSVIPPADAIGAVPYGWRCRVGAPGLFRLGDQAAVIPSLAGEGMGIALASATLAAAAWQRKGANGAPAFQQALARATARPLAVAGLIKQLGTRSAQTASLLVALAGLPGAARLAARLTRI
jgi:menaquinone-9 beta-reductase